MTPIEDARPRGLRADVQGLRAVAVGLVIADHAGLPGWRGGYLGVDVFFVISGFLITGLLLREAAGTGRVRLLDFYARRARRIIPAASVVLAATVVASALFLPVVRASEIFRDAVWAGFFAANIRFASVQTDYFASDRPVSPLQHYWSLAVEEQFYLVWPLLLLVIVVALRRRGGDLRRRVVGVLAVLSAASLAWSVWATHASPDTAYFSTATRAWELGAGALLAAVVHGRTTGSGSHEVPGPGVPRQLVALGGAVAVLVSALVFTPATPVPGWLAAIPVAGTVAVLAAGSHPVGSRTVVARVLALRPLQVLGDWSFSLYLWHFPVLRIARARFGELDAPMLALTLAVVLVLSGATYHLVEQPFRTGRRWRRPSIAVALYPAGVAVLALAIVAANAWVDHRLDRNAGNPAVQVADYRGGDLSGDPAVALVQASVQAADDAHPVPGRLVPGLLDIRSDTAPLGACDYRTGTTRLCPQGDPDADRTIVLLGDSHARAWNPAFVELGRTLGYRVYTFVYSGCPANLAIRLDPETDRPWPACEGFVHWALDQVDRLRPDLAVVSNAPLSPVVDVDGGDVVGRGDGAAAFLPALGRGLRAELDRLRSAAGSVVVLGNTPHLPREQAVCLGQARTLGDCLQQAGGFERDAQLSFAEVARAAGAQWLDASDWFCVRRLCPAVIGDFIPMRDSEHMTTEYAVHLAPSLAAALGLVEPTASPGARTGR
ncbi:SGNH hydrolase domain-containing protein [Nocardioides fonticola]|uniref:SGNH hydrolase domain-containing protein n=1 Tax=Nocardioides fonticola TaxID=450363 RepID=A0ABP7XED0_9ACTN